MEDKEEIMLMQNSALQHKWPVPVATAPKLHVAIICDGNGRWGTSKGLPRSAGHRAGAEAASRVIQCAPHLGIHTLTLFALSAANWKRPKAEIDTILGILGKYLLEETEHCLDAGIRLSIIGRRDRVPGMLRDAITEAEGLTSNGKRLHLRLAIDYSARQTIYQAASKFYKVKDLSSDAFADLLSEVQRGGSTDVDLLIRTGGEQRISDFLLWECAFAEFVFLEKRWPDFSPADLRDAVLEFEKRERTRGALPEECAADMHAGW
jgi:undecaprenyl diphosphate synthase